MLRSPFARLKEARAFAGDAKIQELETRLQEYEEKFRLQVEINARQAELISELERRLGLNSTNSSKPPSSDGLRKPPAPKRANVKERKPGGRKGHKGSTLLRSETPDHIEHHVPHGCTHCGYTLNGKMSVRFETRQVHDIPEQLPLIVVDHLAHTCICPRCKGETRAAFPKGIRSPVQYGSNLTALVIYLNTYQLIPVKRLAETFGDLFGVKLSEGTVVNMVSRAAHDYRGFADRVREAIILAQVKHMDETGPRIEGRLQWLHVACTRMLTYLWIGKGRGDVMLEALGIVVHECWKSYFAMPNVVGHGICRAHILRELENLVVFCREGWAGDLAGLLCRAVHECNLARGKSLSPDIIREVAENHDRIVEEGFRYHESLPPLPSNGTRGRKRQRKGYNLLLRLRDHRGAVLLFTRNPLVPATNNMAELAIRMEKVQQKISGSFRSRQGAINRTIIKTVLATARKQDWNMLETLRASPEDLVERLVVDIPVQAPG